MDPIRAQVRARSTAAFAGLLLCLAMMPGGAGAYEITTYAFAGPSSDTDTASSGATSVTSAATYQASSAQATADLPNGAIRYTGSSGSDQVLSWGSASLTDFVTWQMPFSSAQIGLTWSLDGLNSGSGTYVFGGAGFRIVDVACLNADGTSILTGDCLQRNLAFGLFPDLNGNGLPDANEFDCTASFSGGVFGDEAGRDALCASGSQQISRSGSFTALAGATYRLDMFFALGGTNVSQDWGNTVKVRFDLPENVGFTSDSGALLTAVPEPATLGLLLVGLAGVAVARRRTAA